MNEFWDLFVQDFHATQWPVWFMAAGMFGFGLGWKACCLLKFGDIKMRMHERRILNQIDDMEKLGAFKDLTPQGKVLLDELKRPVLDPPAMKEPWGAKTMRAAEQGTLRRSSTGRVMVSNSPVQQQNSGIDPLTGLLILNAVTDTPAHASGAHTPVADEPTRDVWHTPAPDCSPSHDSGSSYDSGSSSSSDCGSSSDSGGGGSSD